MSETESPWGWLTFADVMLQRAALLSRIEEPSVVLGDDADDNLRRLLDRQPDSVHTEAVAAVIAETATTVAVARDELKRYAGTDTPFGRIVGNAALSPTEMEAFAIIAGIELDLERQRLVQHLFASPWLTPFSLAKVFSGLDVVGNPVVPGSGLRRACLLLPADGPTWATTSLRVAPPVPWWLLGEQPRDSDLPAEAEEIEVAGLGEHDLVLVAGADRVRRLQAVIQALNAPRLLVSPVPGAVAGWDALVRYATLSGSGVVLEVDGGLSAESRQRVDSADHLPWAIASPVDLPVTSLPRRAWHYQPVASAQASAAELESVFGTSAGDLPMMLNATQVQQVAELIPRFSGDPIHAVRWLAHGQLDQLATRIVPRATWSDLILPADRLTLIQEVMVRQRYARRVLADWGMGRGAPSATIAMFTGQSGTGKTLAAEVIAGALGLDLYQIDVAQLVSKYIGETEKNLSRVFDAAESVPCVLFFDEADALFGKRSEVSDAHDRYANIEVAFLLQRLEKHHGIVILASNLAANLDKAFTRRIHVAVDFPLPGPDERRRIWDRILPEAEFRGDLDLDDVAQRFELSGGNIRNAALRAAYLAAQDDSVITMPLLLEALRREMTKLGRHFPK